MDRWVTASAPGSLMIFGEHAVLRGHPAIVAALDTHLSVSVRRRMDRQVMLRSELFEVATALDVLEGPADSRFVLEAIRAMRDRLDDGVDLRIESEFSSTVGFGSSAAVVVATLAALGALCGQPLTGEALVRAGVSVVRSVQGLGSGADVAASVFGGVLRYDAAAVSCVRLTDTLPLVVVYSGSKCPTVEVIRHVERVAAEAGEAIETVFEAMGAVSERAAGAVRAGDFEQLGCLMDVGHGLMAAIGVSNAELDALVRHLRALPGLYGAKISGAGLGDCVIALGQSEGVPALGEPMPVAVSSEGVRLREYSS